MYKVLVCDDEKDIVSAISIYLTSDGYEVIPARNGLEALDIVKHNDVHLVLMDIMMPVMDGIEAMVEIRKISNVPAILLTAKSEDTDKVLGLTVGADDYVTKPFGTAELLARVRATLRNSRFQGTGKCVRESFSLYDMEIEYDARRVSIAGEEIKLTQTEYNIVQLLALHAGKVLTYAEIIKKVWGYSDYGSVKKLQVNMANIRKKFGEKPGE